jgi:hypothetical protein
VRWPLADWRDTPDHLDRAAGARSIYDLGYLKQNLFAGEGFDWFYASPADRAAQLRTPITDGAAGKPWVFRFKDVRSWWSSLHFDRPGGVETATPTAWLPQSKPIWLTEIGCPAVDKGPNQPNVFVDPKSAESFLPFFSRGVRDDLAQRAYLQAIIEAFDPESPGYIDGANPVSTVYAGRMLDLDHVHVYAWDARPYPAFPANEDLWRDGANWQLGHWLNGLILRQPLSRVLAALLDEHGFADHDTRETDGLVTGLVIDRPMSAREALEPLELAFFLDAVESGGLLRFRHRGAGGIVTRLGEESLVEEKPEAPLVALTRAQEADLPAAARIAFSAPESDYRQAIAQSRRLVGSAGRIAEAQLALVMDSADASRTADVWLFETWSARERARFVLPPSALALEPGDVVALDRAGRTDLLRITEIADRGAREIEARTIDPEIYGGGSGAARPLGASPAPLVGPVLGLFLDLPLLTAGQSPSAGFVAAARAPWPGAAAFYRSAEETGYTLAGIATRGAATGITLDVLPPGPESRLDRATSLTVRMDTGTLASTTRLGLLGGANAIALRTVSGAWEVLQFETAELIDPGTYRLTGLLRGQAGTEDAMTEPIPASARLVVLDAAVVPLPLSEADIGLPLNWRYGPADRQIGDASYRTVAHAFQGRGMRPLSPVHIRGRRDPSGDLHLSWVRRTRTGGDSWTAAEVPLGEDEERYEVDILVGASVVRTLATAAPEATYTAAQQLTDHGALQPAVSVRVVQSSPYYGRGTPRAALV